MLKKELSPGFQRYTFDPMPGKQFGNTIYTLTHGSVVLLIDAGYEFQAAQVAKDIQSQGLRLEVVVISHFHDDHMQGLKALPKVTVYGSTRYQTTLDLWTEKAEHQHYVPTAAVETPCTIGFGGHDITLIPFPGHSACTMLTRIDNTWLHIADELMFSIDGVPLLPGAEPGGIPQHVDSLHQLLHYSDLILLPGHGPEVQGKEKIEKEIQNRLTYFHTILRNERPLSYEEASRDCDCTFLHSEWHRFVYE